MKDEFKRSKMICIDVIIFTVLLFLDQITKYLAIEKLKGQDPVVLIKDIFELQYLENRGSAFGMLQNQKFFLLFVGFVFMAILIFFMIKLPNRKKFCSVHILLTIIIAGGIGNMIDRFQFDFVVDFFSFVLIHFPIFNVADCYIVVGTITLFILLIFTFKEKDFEFLNFKQNRYREIDDK